MVIVPSLAYGLSLESLSPTVFQCSEGTHMRFLRRVLRRNIKKCVVVVFVISGVDFPPSGPKKRSCAEIDPFDGG